MARVFPVVVAVASIAGCAQLAGIDNTSGSGRTGNSLEVTRMSIGNQVVLAPLDLAGLPAQYLLKTDSPGGFDRVYATPSGPGLWTQDLAEPAPVEFRLPDVPTPLPQIVSFPNQALKVLFAALEHPNPSPAPSGAMLTVTTQLDVASTMNDSFQVFTVGSWTSRLLTAGVIGLTQVGPIGYAFSSSISQSGRAQLDRLTAQDAFFVLRYAGAALTGVAEAPPFDQTGADMVVTPQMTPVVQDQTLDIKVNPPALAARYAAVRPAVTSLSMNWSAVAAPGYRIASNVGPMLQGGPLPIADVGVSAKYGNPFVARDWHTIFTLQTSESRQAMLPGPMGLLPVTLVAGMNQYIEPSVGITLGLDAGLPELISIGGKQLAADWSSTNPTGQTIPQPTTFLEVTFVSEHPNDTLYTLQVFDFVLNTAGTAFESHPVFSATTNEPGFEVPPEILQAGHYYTLRVMSISGGYPGIAEGDLTNRQLPLSQSYLDSGVFLVTP
ncbi:MAG TPA: hypothetical protein VHN14_33700 [Kofleriaceae bacterium]|nr:hypothetical protein [Kofleriaceae bacterium]